MQTAKSLNAPFGNDDAQIMLVVSRLPRQRKARTFPSDKAIMRPIFPLLLDLSQDGKDFGHGFTAPSNTITSSFFSPTWLTSINLFFLR